MKQVIFAVEDDAALQELYVYSLENEFYCRCFDNGKSFFGALTKMIPDIILLDIMLPGEDGFTILSRLKADKSTEDIPVIIISAKGEETSKGKGLNMGADDYIAKPFGVLEFAARIKAQLRKNNKNIKVNDENIVYKDIFIDFITVNGIRLQITLKEFNLLALLCKNAEKVVDRNTMYIEVWGEILVGETRTLDVHIKEIRRKLAQAKSDAAIKTIKGVGYTLI
jgi:two-component system alkaline phosphatase synthesis response regulator PhoP